MCRFSEIKMSYYSAENNHIFYVHVCIFSIGWLFTIRCIILRIGRYAAITYFAMAILPLLVWRSVRFRAVRY